ncbi:MAG: TolC family outer membrane protein [Burkholderiales bacterium]|jgi:adhesin transport system outer membrane protein|nr:TolC family outer membrane protein [Burkholderiales bacterium]MCA3160869.1 TolC family outer membrane protein [Burkholderiales bacterium]MCA3163658.1 TolC family outer membrane protein [Burkholderiales bacterium]MCA3166573.1 TolC family outer membrane protein [Burkholderiales bacterium]MCA3170038.1 TolC family outer membrane protein [Burkholderiales bacterium]
MLRKFRQKYFITAFLVFFPYIGSAQGSFTLSQAVEQALGQNPEVLVRVYALRAAIQEQGSIAGGYWPRVDLSASFNHQNRHEPGPIRPNFSQQSGSLSVTQMLFDGFSTRNQVQRLGQVAQTRYFEVLEGAESVTLEVSRTYIDLLRYRDLVRAAEQNYVRHRQIFDQIQQRAQAGVARRVDLEQASGRLALAESNLLTEMSNLHDVSARYLRLVGTPAPENLQEPAWGETTRINASEALSRAFAGNPALFAAQRNLRGLEFEIEVRKSRYAPRVDLRWRADSKNRNDFGNPSQSAQIIEILLNFNLFNGGSDLASIRQSLENVNGARQALERVCREVRQTVMIAFNDRLKLAEQLKYLDQHQLSIEKAREAYLRQFEIGQRTLLELLDTENEYFQARRAYVNALRDQSLAEARFMAASGDLVNHFGSSARKNLPSLADIDADLAGGTPAYCQTEVSPQIVINIEALLAKATPMFTPSVAKKLESEVVEKSVAKFIDDWLAARNSADRARLDALYAKQFQSRADNKQSWVARLVKNKPSVSGVTERLDNFKLLNHADRQAEVEVRILKDTRKGSALTTTVHHLTLEYQDGRWQIIQESISAIVPK